MGLLDTIKGWFGKAKETAGDVAEKAGDVAEKGWEKTKEVAGDVAEKAGDVVDDLRGKGDEDGGKPGGDWDDQKNTGGTTTGGG